MDKWLEGILAPIHDGTLLPVAYFLHLDCDKALDARDKNGDLETQWVNLYQEVSRRWLDLGINITDIQQKFVEDIRREAFLKVSRTTGQHEIASYVSDDIDLILRGKLVGLQDSFMDELWAAYQRGEFPTF